MSNPNFNTSNLPLAQLESLKSRTAQIIESIQALQQLLLEADVKTGDSRRINNVISSAMGGAASAAGSEGAGGQQAGGGTGMMALAMPAWPDILAKYNLLLSQTQTVQNALAGASAALSSTRSGNANNNIGIFANVDTKMSNNLFARIALHPASPMTDSQLDNGLAPLLRNQQTVNVLKLENDIVRRLTSRLSSSQANSKNNTSAKAPANSTNTPQNYAAILQECDEIRKAHDSRCERAVRAVAMLRDKYDWKARVVVETEEPEEFVPLSPTLNIPLSMTTRASGEGAVEGGDTPMTGSGESGEGEGDEDEEEELEEVLGPSMQPTPGGSTGTPGGTPMDTS